MTNLLKIHPEITKFEKDRRKLSPEIKKYLLHFRNRFTKINNNLHVFRKAFSSNKKNSIEDLYKLDKSHQWTFTESQYSKALSQLSRITENYPVPRVISTIKEGNYLDLRAVSNETYFFNQLDIFLRKISLFPMMDQLLFSLNSIGKIPTQIIHQNRNKDYFDPLISNKIDTVWTLDVSYNPGLSIKDIIGKQMIEDALRDKKIVPSIIIVEGTSGNTGIGLTVVNAHYGIKTILVIPSKMSQEKINRLRFSGAHVIVTPSKVAPVDPKSYYAVRDYCARKIKGWCSQQYDNPSNAKAHEENTGPVIWEKTQGKVTTLIAPVGTGGTISGTAKFLKKQNHRIKIIGVDTVGSILYLLKEGFTIQEVQSFARAYDMQGFGEDIQPKNVHFELIDKFIRVSDNSGLQMTRILPSLGYIGGQSSGAAYAALIQLIYSQQLAKNEKVMVIFPDLGVLYRQDVFNDLWMKKKGFKTEND